MHFSSCPSRSLNQVSGLQDSLSEFSKNTSGASDFTTAPLYDSTSFSTPPEDFQSSSNNGNDSKKSALRSFENNTSSNYLTCDEGSVQDPHDNTLDHKPLDLKISSPSSTDTPENSTFCEFSSNKSDTNALSGSCSSVSGATISELSTDINDESKQETSNAALSADDSPTRCSSSLITFRKVTQEQHSVCTSEVEIRDININIGQEKNTITEVKASNSAQTNCKAEKKIDQQASDEISAKYSIASNNDNSTQSCSGVNNTVNKTASAQDNNNTEGPVRAVQIDNLRNQIFRLERELILLQLDQSDAVDL